MQTIIDTSTWAKDGVWKIAPAGLPWIAEGSRASIGELASIGERASIGAWASIGPQSSDAIDLGHADGYRKCIAQVQGVAYIGAGCRWFTLAEALEHWSTHAKDRRLTMCLMQSAVAIADLKGWKHA